jgi:hypothetical protein
MKKFLIGFVALSALNVVYASDFEDSLHETKISEDQSYFEVLAERFSNGKKPSLELINNKAISGRCFDKYLPDTPTASAIVTRKKKNEVGPISSPAKAFEIKLIGSNKGMSPDHWDYKTFEELVMPNKNFYSVIAGESSLKILATNSNEYNVEIKLSSNHLVAEFSDELLRPVKGEENRYEYKKVVQKRCFVKNGAGVRGRIQQNLRLCCVKRVANRNRSLSG